MSVADEFIEELSQKTYVKVLLDTGLFLREPYVLKCRKRFTFPNFDFTKPSLYYNIKLRVRHF